MDLLLPRPLHLKLHRLRVTNSLWIPPSDSNVRDLHSSKKSTMRMPLSHHWAPNRSVTLRSNMSTTPIPLMNRSFLVDPADVRPPDSDDDTIPPLGDPEHEFFSETTPPSISLIGAVAFKQLIDAGEEIYTINIQPTSDYQDIEALCTVGNTPTPT